MKTFLTLFLSVNLLGAVAMADVLQDFDGLGDNKDLYDTAKALHPDLKVSVVQDRLINRRNRVELSPEFTSVSGGEKYLDTTTVGAVARYHINPWIAVGARYTSFSNKLTNEAQNLINTVSLIPDVDQPKSQYMGLLDVYPIYGKMNTLGLGITHFDLYLTAGYGKVTLRRDSEPTWDAGGGIGFWWSQHFTTRLELLHQNYKVERLSGNKEALNSTVASLQIGFMI